MKTLRIKLTQSQASYTREETVNNRMTYPLPPFSTIIGALHNACGYKTYHPMEISVQGRYGAMHNKMYTHHTFLNNAEDDRGTLVWFPSHKVLSSGYIVVAEGIHPQHNSFKDRITIREYNTELLEHYISLLKLRKSFKRKETIDTWNNEKRELKAYKKMLNKNSSEIKEIEEKIAKGDKAIKELNERYKKEYQEPYRCFRSLIKAPWHQEVLYDVELVIHVRAEESVLNDIMAHQYDFIALGRSEDFIELQEMKLVNLEDKVPHRVELPEKYTMYINMGRIDKGAIYKFFVDSEKVEPEGTVYYINKKYTINEKGQRIDQRIPCLYTSNVAIDEESEGILWDSEGDYIVDFN